MTTSNGLSPMTSPATIGDALQQAREHGIDRLDAQLLLSRVVERPRTWLLANGDLALSSEQALAIRSAFQRRTTGEPLAYIVGEKEFHGLRLAVDARVLVPRPDTEVLVDWAIDLLARGTPDKNSPRVVDLGTGSGAVALAVKRARPEATVLATDSSSQALVVASGNAARLGLDVAFSTHDWWSGLAGRRFDLVLSNPPYIAEGDPHLPALRHEPAAALTSGIDGMDALRHIISGAPACMAPGGWLLLEHGWNQAEAVQALLRREGFAPIDTRRDLAHWPRCTGGRWQSEAH